MPNPVDIGKYRDKQARRIAEPVTALSDLESLLSRIQQILARHLDLGIGLGSDQAFSELLELLDRPEQRNIQSEASRLLKISRRKIVTQLIGHPDVCTRRRICEAGDSARQFVAEVSTAETTGCSTCLCNKVASRVAAHSQTRV